MGKGTRQSLKQGASSGDAATVAQAGEARNSIFAPINQHDALQPSNRSLSLKLTDFQELVRRSTASIGCVAFSRPVSIATSSPSEFSDRLYRSSSACLEINDAFARLRGYSRGRQLIGTSLATLLPAKVGFRGLFEEWHRRSLTMEGFEWRVMDTEGQEVLIHAALYGTIVNNEISRLWIIFRDVSALSRAITAASTIERHYREILNQPGILFCRVYLDGTLAFATSETRRALALNPLSAATIEDQLRSRSHPEDKHIVDRMAYHRHGLSTAPLTASLRLVTETRGLSSYDLQMLPRVVGDSLDGYDIVAVTRATHYGGDITTTLAAGLAHDANNYLAVASGSIELALQALPAGHPALELLTSATQAISSCAAINTQAIQISPGLQHHPESVDIPQLFDEMISQLAPLMPSGIGLISPPIASRLRAWVDRALLSQAILNLVLNARDALVAKGTITLSATRQGSGPSQNGADETAPIFISVSDNGPGIDDAILGMLFEPFVSSKSQTKTRGLGLTMVKTLVELNGGSVTVTSARGIGTTFTLSLPEAPTTITPLTEQKAIRAPLRAPPTRPLNILIADDESEVRKTLLSAFTSRGHRACAVSNTSSMLGEISRSSLSYDIVIVDDGMLESSAEETSRNVRALAPHLPMVVTSGNTALKANFRAEPDRRFMPKPFALVDLFQEVESLTTVTE